MRRDDPSVLGEILRRAFAGIDAAAAEWQRRNRVLFLFQAIESEDELDDIGMGGLIRATRMFDAESHDPIQMWIDSPGGDIMAGLRLIHVLRDLESPIHTIVLGQAASMAAVVAITGGDKRLAYPWARWLLHRGKTEAHGDADDIGITAKELKTLDGYADFRIVKRTKIPADKLKRMQQKDRWFSAVEALKWGLIDEIVWPRKDPAETSFWIPDRGFLKSIREKEEEEGGEGEPA